MAYLFSTPQQQSKMLAEIGVAELEQLFAEIPGHLRLRRLLDLPAPLTEPELEAHARRLAGLNAQGRTCFLGGGAYDHFVPAVVDEIASRGEFYTAYTPYQPEASQGSLQAFFEYQSLICQLTGFDAANASLYEGGTALSEAAFMAMRVTDRRKKVVVLGSVHPEYRQILQTYLCNQETEIVTIPTQQGTADVDRVAEALDDQTACLLIQHPNFFGCLEPVRELVEAAHQRGALLVMSFDPVSLGMLERPADSGADIAVAEGQPLGIPLQYGGPYLGVLACRQDYVRKMPGRIVVQTVDRAGRRCFVLGLQTREQHIRRDKATSNICTNQGLLALRATVHLALLGPQGLAEAAELCCRKAHYAAEQLERAGLRRVFDRPFFKEFVVRGESAAEVVLDRARGAGFDVGPLLSVFAGFDSGLPPQSLLVAVTEQRTRSEIDALALALGG